MMSVGIPVGGIGKALLAGGREGAAVPGHRRVAARTPPGLLFCPKGQGMVPLRSQVFLHLSYLCCILINQ